MRTTALRFALALPLPLLAASCKDSAATQPAPTTAAAPVAPAPRPAPAAPSAPDKLLFTLRGSSLTRALPVLFPQAASPEVVPQFVSQLTPGAAAHGADVDLGAPVAVAGLLENRTQPGAPGPSPTVEMYVAWPLKPGMAVAQEAREGRGWKPVEANTLWEPDATTARDAGTAVARSADGGAAQPVAGAADQSCWVARREPVGWMLICGPKGGIAVVAPYLRALAVRPMATPTTVLSAALEIDSTRRWVHGQLQTLEAQAPPAAGAGASPQLVVQRAAYDQAHRQVQLYDALASSARSLTLTLTQDENVMHAEIDLGLGAGGNAMLQSLLSAAGGSHRVPRDLFALLPATASSWIAGGIDREAVASVLGSGQQDVLTDAQFGPGVSRVQQLVKQVDEATSFGERVDAFQPLAGDQEGMIRILQRADAVRFVDDLRVAIQSLPNQPINPAQTLRDRFALLPTPGLPPASLRIGQRVNAAVRLSPEERRQLQASTLLVAEGNRLTIVAGLDPVARYRALSQGPRLSATVADDVVLAGHVTPGAFVPFLIGQKIPGLEASPGPDALDFSLRVRPAADNGTRVLFTADAPIAVALEIRQLYFNLQLLQQQQMMQMMQAQEQARQQAAAQRRQAQQAQRQMLDPSMLPEPPRLQLRAPQ